MAENERRSNPDSTPSSTEAPPPKTATLVERFEVEVVYCSPRETATQRVRVSTNATLKDALAQSRMMERFPEIDTERNAVGIFGVIKNLDTQLSPGDRVEIYRSITCDPETVSRRDRPGST